MNIINKLAVISACSIVTLSALSGCADNGQPGGNNYFSKQNIGTVLGGAGGAVIGSNIGKGRGQIVGIAAGTLLGAALGNTIGASLDRADMQYYNNTSQSSLEKAPTGTTQTWRNPDSGNSGTITPVRTYSQNGQYCREYTQTITVGGKRQEGHGVACRQPDGSWQIQQ
ncbi:MAG: glycine zipper 2TM domain-containing protein [Alphaproteobacteria bacterium]|nr:glycine zipper 2TM domain-containing protein [Alphaproteobacteria bacterium]